MQILGIVTIVIFVIAYLLEKMFFGQAVSADAHPSGCFHSATQIGIVCVIVLALLATCGVLQTGMFSSLIK